MSTVLFFLVLILFGYPDFLSSWVEGFQFCDQRYRAPMGYISPYGGYIYIQCTDFTFVGRVIGLTIIGGALEGSSNWSAPFPEAICSLTELHSIEVAGVRFVGPIPSCITKLPNLQVVKISQNTLSGPVPEFYNQQYLWHIDLSANRLSGPIPSSLSTLPKLEVLDLSSNYLTGHIPRGLFQSNPSLNPLFSSLNLGYNNLTGEIPRCLGTADLARFDVRSNQLSGDASFLFGEQKRAQLMILANNNFEFDLSNVGIPKNISLLNLSGNKIYGKVPAAIVTATELHLLDLSFNKLCGELPSVGGEYIRFSPGSFENNSCLCGIPLPRC